MGQIMGKAKNKQGEGKPKHKPKPATKPHHHKSVSAHKPSKAVNSVPVTALGLAATGGIELRAAVANTTTPWAGFSADVPPPLRCEAGARALLPARLPNEVETESPAAFCARRAAQNLKLGRGDLADKLAVAEGKLLKHTQPHVQSNTWSNNLGNAFYCVADLIALYTACGIAPTRAARGVLNGSFASWARTLRNDPERRRSPACAAAVLCRDFGGGSKGACWDAYAYAPVLPELSQAFHKRIHHMIGPKARARPCGLPVPPPPSPMPPPMPPAGQAGNALSALSGAAADAAAASASRHVRARAGTGIVYMRCGDYLARRRGHVLLRLDWLDAFAATAFSSVARVGIVSNRKTHGLGGHNTPQVCVAIVEALRTRLAKLLGPSGPPVSVCPEIGIFDDLHCATQADVLVVASWGTSFGHWASLMNPSCAVIVPQLQGVSTIDAGGKHLEPIRWREGLRYVKARREQWVHVNDQPEEMFRSSRSAVRALLPPGDFEKDVAG